MTTLATGRKRRPGLRQGRRGGWRPGALMQRRPGFPARLPGSGPAAVRPTPVAPAARNPVAAPPVGVGLDSAAVRARMVQKLAAGGITSAAVLQAMGTVERHRFVDSALVNQAYEDTSLPIGLGQTISKPNVVARMCELLLGAEGARTDGLGLPGRRAEPPGARGLHPGAPAWPARQGAQQPAPISAGQCAPAVR